MALRLLNPPKQDLPLLKPPKLGVVPEVDVNPKQKTLTPFGRALNNPVLDAMAKVVSGTTDVNKAEDLQIQQAQNLKSFTAPFQKVPEYIPPIVNFAKRPLIPPSMGGRPNTFTDFADMATQGAFPLVSAPFASPVAAITSALHGTNEEGPLSRFRFPREVLQSAMRGYVKPETAPRLLKGVTDQPLTEFERGGATKAGSVARLLPRAVLEGIETTVLMHMLGIPRMTKRAFQKRMDELKTEGMARDFEKETAKLSPDFIMTELQKQGIMPKAAKLTPEKAAEFKQMIEDRIEYTKNMMRQDPRVGDYLAKKQTPWKIARENTPSIQDVVERLRGEEGQLNFSPREGKDVPLKSNLQAVIDAKLPARFAAAQALNTIRNAGVSKEEIEFSGVEKFLQDNPQATKDQLSEYMDKNKVQVETIVNGGGIDIKSDALNEEYSNAIEGVEGIKRELGAEPFVSAVTPFRWMYKDDSGRSVAVPEQYIGKLDSYNQTIGDYEAQQQAAIEREERGEERGTKYQQYTLPGGENYQEVLVTLPGKNKVVKNAEDDYSIVSPAGDIIREGLHESEIQGVQSEMEGTFKTPHFDEPNILVHLRTTDRKAPAGGKVLFIEEIQSDWHARGKKQGYAVKPERKAELEKRRLELENLGRNATEEQKKQWAEVMNELQPDRPDRVPNAPFKNTWHELALKQAIDMAVKGGYDKVAWISGQQTADRYDLSKQVDSVSYKKEPDGIYDVRVAPKGQGDGIFKKLKESELAEFIGKDIANKIIKNEGRIVTSNFRRLDGLDLKVGGEWAKKFYDEILPSAAQKYIKKWGGKVEDISVDTTGEKQVGRQARMGRLKPGGFALIDSQGNFRYAGPTEEEARSFARRAGMVDYQIVKNDIDSQSDQKGFTITPQMKKEIAEIGQPLFGTRLAGGIADLLKEQRGMAGPEASEPLPDDLSGPPELFKELRKSKTQKEKVAESVKDEPKTIKEIADQTKILEPNVRRILGVGAKEGTFTRVDKGVYILNAEGKDVAWIHAGDAREVLPRLAKEGVKVDMAFLDIPYKTAGVTGGNRGIDFAVISPEDFKKDIVGPIKAMVRTDDSPIVYMYSNSKTGFKDMMKYNQAIMDSGLKVIAQGTYTKTYKSGKEMMFGRYPMPPEGIIVFNKSGDNADVGFEELPAQFDIRAIAPLYKGHYQTEKAIELLRALIMKTTQEGDTVLDPFAGSGVTLEQAIAAGRKAIGVEVSKDAIEKHIKPRVEKAGGVAPPAAAPPKTTFEQPSPEDLPPPEKKFTPPEDTEASWEDAEDMPLELTSEPANMEEWAQFEIEYLNQNDFLDPLEAAMKEVGKIRPYEKGHELEEYRGIPARFRSGSGKPLDKARQDLEENHNILFEVDGDLIEALKKLGNKPKRAKLSDEVVRYLKDKKNAEKLGKKLERSIDRLGKHLEHAIAPRRYKTIIEAHVRSRKVTPVKITEEQGLKFRFRQQAKGAKAGYKAGRRELRADIKRKKEEKKRIIEAAKRFPREQRYEIYKAARKAGLILPEKKDAEGKIVQNYKNRLTPLLRFYKKASFDEIMGYIRALRGDPDNPPLVFKISGDPTADAETMKLIAEASEGWDDINRLEIGTLDLPRIVEKVSGLEIFEDNILADNTYEVLKGADDARFERMEAELKDLEDKAKEYAEQSRASAELMRKFESGEGLTERQQKVADYLRSKYDALIKEANENRERLGKKPIPYRKDYMTHIRDWNLLTAFFKGDQSAMDNLTNEQWQALAKGQYAKISVPFNKFAQQRLGNKTKFDAIGNYKKYLETILYEVYMSPAIKHARVFTDYALLKQPNAKIAMDNLLDELAGKPSSFDHIALRPIFSNAFVKWLNNRFGQNALIGNISYYLTNASNIATASGELGNYTIKGMHGFLSNAYLRQLAFSRSSILKSRKGLFDYEISRLEAFFSGHGKDLTAWENIKLKDKQMEFIISSINRVIEYNNVGSSWVGAYLKAIDKFKFTPEKAYKYADSIARKTQGGYRPYEMPAWMRSAIGKVTSKFGTWAFNMMNYFLYDLKLANLPGKAIGSGKPVHFGKFIVLVGVLMFVNALYEKMGLRKPYSLKSFVPQTPLTRGRYQQPPLGRIAEDVKTLLPLEGARKEKASTRMKALEEITFMLGPRYGGAQLRRFAHGDILSQKKKEPERKHLRLLQK
jgi:DNA modification methylase